MKKIIVTAANEKFAPLLLGLLRSLHQWNERLSDAIGVLDLGLSEETRHQISRLADQVIVPDWDVPFDATIRETQPHLRAMSARPFLPRYFPGYDLYLWLDADAWVQERYAVEWFFLAASRGAMAIVPEVDRSYVQHPSFMAWRQKNLQLYFGEKAAALAEHNAYFNSGAFSLRADAPHWAAWQAYFRSGLSNHPLGTDDQSVLNYAIWDRNLPVHPLPALCNWCCHLAVPSIKWSARKFCEPYLPGQSIGLIHLTANTKDLKINWNANGQSKEAQLHFGSLDQAR